MSDVVVVEARVVVVVTGGLVLVVDGRVVDGCTVVVATDEVDDDVDVPPTSSGLQAVATSRVARRSRLIELQVRPTLESIEIGADTASET